MLILNQMKNKLEIKLDQIHFIDKCIVDLKHLERYSSKLEEYKEDLNPLREHILKTLKWLFLYQEKITEEINNLKEYGSYNPQSS